MSCANHSIYINGRNINLSQFEVRALIDDRWEYITDGRRLQSWLKEHDADSVTLSVLPRGTLSATEPTDGWVTTTSSQYLLGKGKQIANGKPDPLFEDLTTSRDGVLLGLAVSTISARVKDGVLSSDDKVAKNWRKAQADALLQFFEERVARGDSTDQAFSDSIRFVLGRQHSMLNVVDELEKEFGTRAPFEPWKGDRRRALSELHRMVKDDTLQPALELMGHLAMRNTDNATREVMRSKRIGLVRAADMMKALRDGENPVSPQAVSSFLASCSSAGGLGTLDREELASKQVRAALETLAEKSKLVRGLSVIDVVDVAGSICTNRRNPAMLSGPETWVTMDGATTGFEGIRAIHEFDVSDVTKLLALKPARTRHPNIDPTRIPDEERSALPQVEIDSPARVARAARALKTAQAALSHNTTAYGGKIVLDAADKIEELTGGRSITETQRFLNDVLSQADPAQATKQRRQLDDATNRARAVIHNMLTGALQKDHVDPDAIAEVGDYRKAVEGIINSVLLEGDPATFLRAISSTRTTIELMRFSVASGYVPRKGGNIEDTAADIQRVLAV
jgi:hypothetical protein